MAAAAEAAVEVQAVVEAAGPAFRDDKSSGPGPGVSGWLLAVDGVVQRAATFARWMNENLLGDVLKTRLVIQVGGGSGALSLAMNMRLSSPEGYSWMWTTGRLHGVHASCRRGVTAEHGTEIDSLHHKIVSSMTLSD